MLLDDEINYWIARFNERVAHTDYASRRNDSATFQWFVSKLVQEHWDEPQVIAKAYKRFMCEAPPLDHVDRVYERFQAALGPTNIIFRKIIERVFLLLSADAQIKHLIELHRNLTTHHPQIQWQLNLTLLQYLSEIPIPPQILAILHELYGVVFERTEGDANTKQLAAEKLSLIFAGQFYMRALSIGIEDSIEFNKYFRLIPRLLSFLGQYKQTVDFVFTDRHVLQILENGRAQSCLVEPITKILRQVCPTPSMLDIEAEFRARFPREALEGTPEHRRTQLAITLESESGAENFKEKYAAGFSPLTRALQQGMLDVDTINPASLQYICQRANAVVFPESMETKLQAICERLPTLITELATDRNAGATSQELSLHVAVELLNPLILSVEEYLSSAEFNAVVTAMEVVELRDASSIYANREQMINDFKQSLVLALLEDVENRLSIDGYATNPVRELEVLRREQHCFTRYQEFLGADFQERQVLNRHVPGLGHLCVLSMLRNYIKDHGVQLAKGPAAGSTTAVRKALSAAASSIRDNFSGVSMPPAPAALSRLSRRASSLREQLFAPKGQRQGPTL